MGSKAPLGRKKLFLARGWGAKISYPLYLKSTDIHIVPKQKNTMPVVLKFHEGGNDEKKSGKSTLRSDKNNVEKHWSRLNFYNKTPKISVALQNNFFLTDITYRCLIVGALECALLHAVIQELSLLPSSSSTIP